MSRRVLLTGFEPFGAHTENPSGRLAAVVGERLPANVIARVLPTTFVGAEARVRSLIHEHQPCAVLLLGLSAAARTLTFELIAQNLDHSCGRDNRGVVRQGTVIAEGAPVAYRSTLPMRRMRDLASDLGAELDCSRDAGGFVCNHVFFSAAHLLANSGTPCGFVHIPQLHGSSGFNGLIEVAVSWTKLLFGR